MKNILKFSKHNFSIKREYIYGLHTVEASLLFSFRKSLDLFVQMSYKENMPEHIQKIVDLAKLKNIKVKFLPRDKMEKFTSGRPHNGLVLKSEPRDYIIVKYFENFFDSFIKKPKGNVLILFDQIADPQNLGAMIRTAFFYGVDGILFNNYNKPTINSTICKVSSGASECTNFYSVINAEDFLIDAMNKKWVVIHSNVENDMDVEKLSKLSEITNFDYTKKYDKNYIDKNVLYPEKIPLNELKLNENNNVIIVFGSQYKGLYSKISRVANYNIYIPSFSSNVEGGCNKKSCFVNSMHAGVSTGILINNIKSQLLYNQNYI